MKWLVILIAIWVNMLLVVALQTESGLLLPILYLISLLIYSAVTIKLRNTKIESRIFEGSWIKRSYSLNIMLSVVYFFTFINLLLKSIEYVGSKSDLDKIAFLCFCTLILILLVWNLYILYSANSRIGRAK